MRSENLSHDEAIKALCDCAATTTVLSYQEAIEGYFSLRGLPIPPEPTAQQGGEEERAAELIRSYFAARQARNDCPECGNEGPWEHCGPCSDRIGPVIARMSNFAINMDMHGEIAEGADKRDAVARIISLAKGAPENGQTSVGAWWWDKRHDRARPEHFEGECRDEDRKHADLMIPLLRAALSAQQATKASKIIDGLTEAAAHAAGEDTGATVHHVSVQQGGEEADRIEACAQWLHDEGGFDDAWTQHTWPEHPDDTGQRDGGFVKIVPSDVQAKFREVATRLLKRFPGALSSQQASGLRRIATDPEELQSQADAEIVFPSVQQAAGEGAGEYPPFVWFTPADNSSRKYIRDDLAAQQGGKE